MKPGRLVKRSGFSVFGGECFRKAFGVLGFWGCVFFASSHGLGLSVRGGRVEVEAFAFFLSIEIFFEGVRGAVSYLCWLELNNLSFCGGFSPGFPPFFQCIAVLLPTVSKIIFPSSIRKLILRQFPYLTHLPFIIEMSLSVLRTFLFFLTLDFLCTCSA